MASQAALGRKVRVKSGLTQEVLLSCDRMHTGYISFVQPDPNGRGEGVAVLGILDVTDLQTDIKITEVCKSQRQSRGCDAVTSQIQR